MASIHIGPPYPIPSNERERLSALRECRIMDSDPEPIFDRVAQLAGRLFQAPIALVTLVESDRQWFKARCGFEATETPRAFSFCTYAMLGNSPMVVCDATKDPRFADNALVTGDLSIRFYAGAPLVTRAGLPFGALCIIDQTPREYPDQSLLESLTDLAVLVTEQLESRASYQRMRDDQRSREQLEQARQLAEAASEAKSDFLARMSHEIRTPMNLINGMNALLLESPMNEKQRRLVGISHRNIRRLLRLINGILDLSKVEAGGLTLLEVAFSLREVLNEATATVSSAVEQKGLALEVSIAPAAGLYWRGDPERLQQILLNLIGNSIKFTVKGSISVHVEPETDEQGKIGLRFSVADSGPGIRPDKADAIFGAFQQGDESNARSQEGTGLGLAIARSLVERMSGKIWLESKVEPGAKFVFTLFLPPLTEDDVKRMNDSAGAAQPAVQLAPGLRILLAEDNPEGVILVEAYLGNFSPVIEVAVNGVEVVEMRKRQDYALILMDIQMPFKDGYTATREIRLWEKAEGARRIPIVALTANALNGANANSVAAGCDGYVSKPVERRELAEAIAKFARKADAVISNVVEQEAISDLILARRPVFLAKRRADLEKMRDALAAGDYPSIQSIAHNCKGISKSYGFPEMGLIGAEIEKAAKAAVSADLQISIGDFERCVQAAST
jgi:two-component system, sensor histidine kinase